MHSAGLVSLIRFSENLESLDVRDCELISNELINVAIEVTKCRKDRILKILAFGTSVNMNEIKESSPFLEVSIESHLDLCCKEIQLLQSSGRFWTFARV